MYVCVCVGMQSGGRKKVTGVAHWRNNSSFVYNGSDGKKAKVDIKKDT